MNTLSRFLCLLALLALAAPATAQVQRYRISMDGFTQSPPIDTPGNGSGTLELDETKMLSFDITVQDLLGFEVAAHIHGPVLPDNPFGVKKQIPNGARKVGEVGPLSEFEEGDLNAGRWYILVHTSVWDIGEIKGFIQRTSVANEATSWSRVKALY